MDEQPPESQDKDHRRIDELEAQVRELSGLVEILLTKPENQETVEEAAIRGRRRRSRRRSPMLESVREAVARALGGEEGESLESRIGGIWLGRIVAVLFMTLFVLGGLITLQDDTLGALAKIILGYGIAGVTIGYGLYKRNDESFFPQTVLGLGMAAFYFTSYAAFFLETTQLFHDTSLGIGVLAGALLVVAGVAHVRRSATAAGISLFLIYYTVFLSLATTVSQEHIVYALVTCSLLALVALLFHLTHRWLLFTWGALIATQLTYIYFFIVEPPQLDLSPEEYFWFSNAFLTLIFCVFSIACVTDAHRTGEYRKTVAPMAGVNSFVYLALTWIAVRNTYPEYEWAFRFGQTAMFLVFMAYAHFAGRPKNYLFQIFAAKSFIIFTLALQAYLSHEWLLIAMAIECLALGFSYLRSGLVIFKVLGQGLLIVVVGASFYAMRSTDEIEVLGYIVSARWFSAVGVAFVLSIVAWFYHHYVKRVPPEQRVVKSQWFLADTWLDLSGGGMALLHAAAGALILTAITILDLGSDPRMPYLLAGQGIAMAVVGLILAAPQVEVASVLLLIASHVCYHLFLLLGIPGFETQPNYTAFTLVVALITFLGGYLWERYLNRIQGGTQFEHDAMAAIPFVAATLMLVTLAEQTLDPLMGPMVHLMLAVLLLFMSAVTRMVGLRFAGVLTLIAGTWSYYDSMFGSEARILDQASFPMGLLVALLCYAAAERACALWERRVKRETRGARPLRTLIVITASVTGLIGLWQWAPDDLVSRYWLAHAVGAMVLGVVFWERRYRWAALALYFTAVGRAFLHDLANLDLMLKFLSIAALTIPGFLIFWGYSEYRSRYIRRLERKAREERLGTTEQPLQDGTVTDG